MAACLPTCRSTQWPWTLAADFAAERFLLNPEREEALARLHFLVDAQRRVGLVLGGTGCGKTWILESFRRDLCSKGRLVAAASLKRCPPEQLPVLLLAQLGGDYSSSTLRGPQGWLRLGRRMGEISCFEQEAVLLFDDADRAGRHVLIQLSQLIDGAGAVAEFTTVLACQAARGPHLGAKLLDLVDLRIDLG